MQIFINETSLNSQFDDQYIFFDSLKIFLSSIKKINEIKRSKNIFKSDNLFYYTGISGSYLETTLKKNHSLNAAFVQNLKLVNPKSWQDQKFHEESSSYRFNNNEFVGTSVAELAERKNLEDKLLGFLLNFSDSQFGNNIEIDVLKNESDSIKVDCAITPEDIEQWLIDNDYINTEVPYDEELGISPADCQTVLRNASLFEKTSYPRNNGRIVYRRIGTNQLWTVDNSKRHVGTKAHIEVFDERTRKHLGTSLYNIVNVDDSFKADNRYINLG